MGKLARAPGSQVLKAEADYSQLEQQFGLATTRARDAWHLTNRVTRKVLAHTVGVWLNLQ